MGEGDERVVLDGVYVYNNPRVAQEDCRISSLDIESLRGETKEQIKKISSCSLPMQNQGFSFRLRIST